MGFGNGDHNQGAQSVSDKSDEDEFEDVRPRSPLNRSFFTLKRPVSPLGKTPLAAPSQSFLDDEGVPEKVTKTFSNRRSSSQQQLRTRPVALTENRASPPPQSRCKPNPCFSSLDEGYEQGFIRKTTSLQQNMMREKAFSENASLHSDYMLSHEPTDSLKTPLTEATSTTSVPDLLLPTNRLHQTHIIEYGNSVHQAFCQDNSRRSQQNLPSPQSFRLLSPTRIHSRDSHFQDFNPMEVSHDSSRAPLSEINFIVDGCDEQLLQEEEDRKRWPITLTRSSSIGRSTSPEKRSVPEAPGPLVTSRRDQPVRHFPGDIDEVHSYGPRQEQNRPGVQHRPSQPGMVRGAGFPDSSFEHQQDISYPRKFNNDSLSDTQVPENFSMNSSSLILSGIVNLSLMRTPANDGVRQMTEYPLAESNGKAVKGRNSRDVANSSSNATRTAQESLDRHIHFHLRRVDTVMDQAHEVDGINFIHENLLETFQVLRTPSLDSTLDSESLIGNPVSDNLDACFKMARDYLRNDDVEAAVVIYQRALENQRRAQEQLDIIQDALETPVKAETLVLMKTLSELSVLFLFAGRNEEAMDAAGEASALILGNDLLAEKIPFQVFKITMAVGLIHFAGDCFTKALESWKQTLDTCCQVFGSDNPVVAVLMNNIGVLHAEMGNTQAAFKELEESLKVQHTLLDRGQLSNHDYALHQMATTVSNLAMLLELRENFASAIIYLEDAQVLYESLEGDDDDFRAFEDIREMDQRSESLHSSQNGKKLSNPYRNQVNKIAFHHVQRLQKLREQFLISKIRHAPLNLIEKKSVDDASSVSTYDAEATADAFVASLIDKRSFNGKHGTRQKENWKALQLADVYDYMLLGSITVERTPRERVRETVLAYFGQLSAEKNASAFVPFPTGLAARRAADNPQYHHDVAMQNFSYGFGDGTPTHGRRIQNRAISHRGKSSPDKGFADVDNDVDIEFAPVLSEMMVQLASGDLGRALEVCQKALEEYKTRQFLKQGLVGTVLHMIGMLHLLAEEYLLAYGVLKEAVKVRREAHGPDSEKLASTMMKLALVQYAAMDVSASGRTMGDIRAIFLKISGFGHPHLAQIMNNIGVLRYETGDICGAIRAMEIAYEYQRKSIEDSLREAEETEQEIDLHYSQVLEVVMGYTLSNLAFLYYCMNDHLSSLRLYEEAKTILSWNASLSERVVLQIEESIAFLNRRRTQIFDYQQCAYVESDSAPLPVFQGPSLCYSNLVTSLWNDGW